MVEVETAQKLPPYVPFKSFMKLVDALRIMVPGRLDGGYMASQKFSGTVSSQILTACRFLGLVSGVEPEDTLRTWVKQDGDEWKRTFEKVLRTAYAPIFEMNLENATQQMLRERFKKSYGADGEVASKCIVFFTQACRLAGIQLSPLISQRIRAASNNKPRRRRKDDQQLLPDEITSVPPEPALTSSPNPPSSPSEVEWAKFRVLVDKFPRFDPTWPDDLKSRWFAAYETFMTANISTTSNTKK